MVVHQQDYPVVARKSQKSMLVFPAHEVWDLLEGSVVMAFLLGFAFPLQEDLKSQYEFRDVKHRLKLVPMGSLERRKLSLGRVVGRRVRGPLIIQIRSMKYWMSNIWVKINKSRIF